MASNAYIARGNRGGNRVMKVGKANNVRLLEKQIAATIEFTIACLDEAAAFRVESKLRDFVVGQGGIRYLSTLDWFEFDQRLYEMLSEFASNLNALPLFDPEEHEISLLLDKYHQLVADERELAAIRGERDAALAQAEELRKKITILEQKLQAERQQHKEELRLEQVARREDIKRLTQKHSENIQEVLRERMSLMQHIRELENELKHDLGETSKDDK
jgi:hypothetical protein